MTFLQSYDVHSYEGYEYRCWAERQSDGTFQPRLAISRYHANRQETLEKHFHMEKRFSTEAGACAWGRSSAVEIIDGLHPDLTVNDISFP